MRPIKYPKALIIPAAMGLTCGEMDYLNSVAEPLFEKLNQEYPDS